MTNNRTKINIGRNVSVMHFNIESSSSDKSEVLSRKSVDNEVDIIAIQETHIENAADYHTRGHVPGFKLAAYVLSKTYGIATYIKETHVNYNVLHVYDQSDVSCIVVELFGIKVVNVYKPPSKTWPEIVLHREFHPSVYVGDFNSHHSLWGYARNNADGNKLVEWAESHNLFLVHDLKDLPTFQSGRWQRGYNPDLCFVSRDQHDKPLKATRRVLNYFPRSQHRPVIIKIGVQIELVNSIPKPRWNFQKADWSAFSSRVDAAIRFVPNDLGNYDRFIGVVKSAAKKSTPRGYRKRYIPCWTAEMQELYEQFEEQGDDEISDHLLELLSAARKIKWEKATQEINFTQSSRKCWSLLRHLGESSKPIKTKSCMDTDHIASKIVENSTMIAPSKHHKRIIKSKLKKLIKSLTESEFDQPFSIDELDAAISSINAGKAAGLDGLYPEFLKHLGKRARIWVLKFMNQIFKMARLPPLMMKTIIIAILKPGKNPELTESYRPIALLSLMYKLLEKLIYHRIKLPIDAVLPDDQAAFRENRGCVEQVLALTSHVEVGFQKNLKTGLALIDLSSAYDTIWRIGFLWKYYKVIPSRKLGKLVNSMLTNRIFRVFINDRSSRPRVLNNGFGQGSVCAPIFFNLYTSDMPITKSRKFSFADDLGLTVQAKYFETVERILERDMGTMKQYYWKWCLCMNDGKSEVSVFHMNNQMANRKLGIRLDGEEIRFNSTPTYLGLPLDRSLTFKPALTKLSEKLKSRINLVQKLVGTDWGANGNTLRTAVLSMIYSVAEYCAPVWYRSSHVNKVDTQLNIAMRTIAGAVDSTPVPWLHVLSNIAPPHLRRQAAARNEWNKCFNAPRNYRLPIAIELENPPPERLISRTPIWNDHVVQAQDFDIKDAWKRYWTESIDFTNKSLIENPHEKLEGFGLERREWRILNRFRCGHGCCRQQLHRWNFIDSPYCDCDNVSIQSMNHVLNDCHIRRFMGSLSDLNLGTDEAIEWLKDLDLNI